MTVMAVAGPLLGLLLLLAYGIYLLSASGKGGTVVAGLGGLLLLLWAIMIPVARRKNKI
ncbi:hypothetical protein [Streptomyces sp. NPDC008125]|uniref:hypothetical protein n=1 Tax=Streptomyces sp. NPDC008125 TaxID=3364811 RepID=UPI0036E73866